MTCTCLAGTIRPKRPWRLETAPWPSRGEIVAENKGAKLGALYLIGFSFFFLYAESDFMFFLGFFTIFFTGLAHLIMKIVTLQDGFRAEMSQQGFAAGNSVHHRTNRSNFNSRSQGNYRYDQLIRKMKVTDLSGMSVDEAASTYASFFSDPSSSSKPFFSNPYVQEVLNMGATQVSAQTIAGSNTPDPSINFELECCIWSSMPESSTEATEKCANPTCSTPVTVFDFRCFNCRNRFCAACKGDKITCPSCS